MKTLEDENTLEGRKERLNNEMEDIKYINYTKTRDSFENPKSKLRY